MKLPFREQAIIEIEKLREYCLTPQHPRGQHKARVFASALGFIQGDAEQLRGQLLDALRHHDAQQIGEDVYGTRYEVTYS